MREEEQLYRVFDYNDHIRAGHYNLTDTYPPELVTLAQRLDPITGWKPVGYPPKTRVWEEQRAIGLGLVPCPFCGAGDGRKVRRTYNLLHESVEPVEPGGEPYKVLRPVLCACALYVELWKHWKDVPPAFERTRLSDLRPSKNSLISTEMQARYIKRLQAQPKRSYIMSGDAGCGKSVFAFALLHHAYIRRAEAVAGLVEPEKVPQNVFYATAPVLLKQFHLYETRDHSNQAPEPPITEAKIRAAHRAGLRPTLVLEEVDKITMSDFKYNVMFSLLNAVYEVKGQIVVTANMSLSVLAGHFRNQVLWRRLTSPEREGDEAAVLWSFEGNRGSVLGRRYSGTSIVKPGKLPQAAASVQTSGEAAPEVLVTDDPEPVDGSEPPEADVEQAILAEAEKYLLNPLPLPTTTKSKKPVGEHIPNFRQNS